MNKLLVTGMAVGRDAGVCDPCNYDLGWLINYPSVLLWADRILITETVWNVIQKAEFPHPNELPKACGLVFDIARDRGIVEIAKPTPLLKEEVRNAILTQVETDFEKVKLLLPDKIEERELAVADHSVRGVKRPERPGGCSVEERLDGARRGWREKNSSRSAPEEGNPIGSWLGGLALAFSSAL